MLDLIIMIKEDVNAIMLSKSDYIDLSAQLRKELELKFDNLHLKNPYLNYSDKRFAGLKSVSESNCLCTYLIAKAPRNYIVSGKLLRGVKTWFNMYYSDRLSVIYRFKVCYHNAIPSNKRAEKRPLTVAFCKFLISELLSTLAESRWQALAHRSE